ncbi:TPA: type II toxin-antitoxin system YhaV family toxin [Pseudomonas aeruginosa]|nr:type II toxin-antitoxin system YhaV family toxin [Pseudomonas aeruginosa]
MHTGNVTVINGWQLFGHPLFIERLDALVAEAEALSEVSPDDFHKHSLYKLYEKVEDAVLQRVPADPCSATYHLGNTLGEDFRHWKRVKSGLPDRYRLFFQYRSDAPKSIIYAWLNDNLTLRKAGARTDVYRVFRAMLEGGRMPNSFQELMRAATPMEAGGEE